jgi:tape measure domain-containing protein
MADTLELIITARDMATAAINNVMKQVQQLAATSSNATVNSSRIAQSAANAQMRVIVDAARAQERAIIDAARNAERAHTNSFSNMGRVASSVMQGIGMAVGFNVLNMGRQIADSLMGAVRAGLEFNDTMFKMSTGFTTLTRDIGTGRQMVEDMFLLAAKTPATFEQVATGAQRLLAYGWAAKEVSGTLQTLVDAASALGRDSYTVDHLVRALGQMQNKGHVMTQEMIQFSEAGVNAWQYLAETLNVDVATAMKMVEDRAVDSGVAIKGILYGMQRDFGGMAQAMNKSMSGLTTTVVDYGSRIASEIFQPTYDGIRSMLDEFATIYLPQWLKAVQDVRAAADREKLVPEDIKNRGVQAEQHTGELFDKTKTQAESEWSLFFTRIGQLAGIIRISGINAVQDVINEALGKTVFAPKTSYGIGKAMELELDTANQKITQLQEKLANAGPRANKSAIRAELEAARIEAGMLEADIARLNNSLFLGMAALQYENRREGIPRQSSQTAPVVLPPDLWNTDASAFMNKYTPGVGLYNKDLANQDAIWKLLSPDITNAEGALSAWGIALNEAVASGAPADAIAAIREEMQTLTSDIAIYKKAWALYESGTLTLDAVQTYVKTQQDAAKKVASAWEKSAKDSQKSYQDTFKDMGSKISGLLSPTSVTAGDMFKTQTGMFGGYQDKWDEYIRRLEAGVNGSKEWAHMVPDAVKKMTKEQKQGWLAETKNQFYGGYMPENVDWGAFVKSYGQSVMDDAQKQALTDRAMKELEKAGFKGNADDVKIALGLSSGGEKAGKTYAQGYTAAIKEANLPAETTRIVADQLLANQKPVYDSGAVVGNVFYKGLVNGANVDVMKALVDKLTGPVSDNIDRRKNAGGQP